MTRFVSAQSVMQTKFWLMKTTFVVWLCCLAGTVNALSQTIPEPQETTSDTKETREQVLRDASLAERALAAMRAPIGFSFGVMELSAPNFSAPVSTSKSLTFTMVQPRVFSTLNTGRTHFQFDYTFGFRRSNQHKDIRASEHAAGIRFDYQLSRNLSLQLADNFRSAIDDYGTFLRSSLPAVYDPSFSQPLYALHSRMTTNSLITSLNYHASKRSNISVISSYDRWRFSNSSFGAVQGVQAGVRSEYQVNKWLFLQNSYFHYLNQVDPRFQAGSIQRLQVGGLNFVLRRNLQLSIAGGADHTRYQEGRRTGASLEAGLSKTSRSARVNLHYYRGFYRAVGPQALMGGDMFSASYGQWLSRRVSVNLDSAYNRGAALSGGSKLQYLSASAEVQVALQRHVMWTAQFWYISQRGSLVPAGYNVGRMTGSTGLYFFLPPIGGRPTARR